jgi:hypothetical protein
MLTLTPPPLSAFSLSKGQIYSETKVAEALLGIRRGAL